MMYGITRSKSALLSIAIEYYPTAVFKSSHTKFHTQPKLRPFHVTNFSHFDQSEVTFEMYCSTVGYGVLTTSPVAE